MDMRLLLVTLLFGLLLPVNLLLAGEFTSRPFLIDVAVQARDVVNETVRLTNDSTYRKYVVYATVNEISVDATGEIKQFVSPVMTDRSNTVTSWIEVKRSRIEVMPGEQLEVPLVFRISPYAEPGEYHAFIGFVPAPNRPAADKIALAGEADGVVVKIVVADERKESVHISNFSIDRFVVGDDSRDIAITVENRGDFSTAPTGEIIFYNSRGEEVNSVSVNDAGEVIAPGTTAVLKSQVPIEGAPGRFKANLALKYSENQRASLQDTTFFYVMPLPMLVGLFLAILIISIFVAFLFRRSFFNDEFHDGTDEVTMYVRDGHEENPQDHDINLKK